MTLRRWGHVHAGGESCARAGEGVTLEKSIFFDNPVYIYIYIYKTRMHYVQVDCEI